jgi:hypothetical protein
MTPKFKTRDVSKTFYRSEAEKVLKDCERFLEFVRKKLP